MNNIKTKILDLPPLSELVEQYDLTPYKSLGQNFIFDLNLTRKIARAANLSSNETIFEIGPGPLKKDGAQACRLYLAVEANARLPRVGGRGGRGKACGPISHTFSHRFTR
jgi:hypothetical protein